MPAIAPPSDHAHAAGRGIDVHAHVVPEHFPPYLGRRSPSGWPSTAPAHACHRHVIIDGANYRTVSSQCWDVPTRLADLDRLDLELQVVSPMPELLSYWLPLEDGKALIRYLNEQIAEMIALAPDRFIGLGAVPLQDVDSAIVEMDFLIKK